MESKRYYGDVDQGWIITGTVIKYSSLVGGLGSVVATCNDKMSFGAAVSGVIAGGLFYLVGEACQRLGEEKNNRNRFNELEKELKGEQIS